MRDALTIAYAPASYYRPWQDVYATASPQQQRWLNSTLIQQRRLPLPQSLTPPSDPLARRLIGLWDRVPQVATLMAAARLRGWLAAQRGSAALPSHVQAFMRAGYARDEARVVPVQSLHEAPAALLHWGAAELRPLAPMLPAWLTARLCLPFAGPADERPPARDRADMDLFWSAVTYVEKLS